MLAEAGVMEACSAPGGGIQQVLSWSKTIPKVQGATLPLESNKQVPIHTADALPSATWIMPTSSWIIGQASWYGPGFDGKLTASGEVFDQDKLTAAHKTLPLGSRARVTNLNNEKTVEVEINDRGPYIDGRIIDLSRGAARKLDMIRQGTTRVQVEILDTETGRLE